MNIEIFKDLTTENALIEIEQESEKYIGLYVEMENKEERKYVKDKAVMINSLLKKLERARIDKSKEFKLNVESEASRIKERLERANKPFTLLIDEYKLVREKQLEKEKALQDAKDLIIQIKIDHDESIMMNKIYDMEKQEVIDAQKERDEKIAQEARADAEARARQSELDKITAQEKAIRDAETAKEREKQAKIAADNAEKQRLIDVEQAKIEATDREIERQKQIKKDEVEAQRKLESNKAHISKVQRAAKVDLIDVLGMDEKLAISVVMAITKKLISNLSINY